MYYDYFGLKQPPFKITPDTKLFYPGGNRGAILDALMYAITNGEGIVKVVGEVGSGKTMLCRMLEKELPDNVEIVYIANPSIAPDQILHAIAHELKLNVTSQTPQLQVTTRLQDYLVTRHSKNRQVVVFVEEAQAMPIATLEQIRLLSNLETQTSKLLQIVLFGQPELDSRIATPEIRQLKERITYSFQLNPFENEDIRDYLNSRLRVCGYRAGDLFSAPAIREIQRYSRGLLRRINILADKSLLAAYAESKNEIHASHVRQAARDSEFVTRRTLPWLPALSGSALAIVVALFAFWLWTALPEKAPPLPAGSQAGKTTTAAPLTATAGPPPTSLAEVPPGVEPHIPTGAGTDTVATPAAAAPPDGPAAGPAGNGHDDAVTAAADAVTGTGTDTPVDDPVRDPGPAHGNAETSAAVTGLAADPPVPASVSATATPGLLNLESVYNLQDFGDARLSTQESVLLQQQLLQHPPEMARYDNLSPEDDNKCRLCWSIIYRPLIIQENL